MNLIAFRHSDPRPFARLVTALRGGDSAHCEFAVHEGSSRLSLCVSASFMDGGVRGKLINVTNPHKWRVYRWPHACQNPQQWLVEHYGAGYDLRGLVGILAPKVGHSRSKRFCSEAVAEIINIKEPHSYDLRRLEDLIKQPQCGVPVIWVGNQWSDLPPESTHGLTPAH